jgi:predicted metal-dependent peptidase
MVEKQHTPKQVDKTPEEIMHTGIESINEANRTLQRASVKNADIFVISHGLRHIPLIPDTSIQSLCTDGNVLRYNPLWIGQLKLYLDTRGNAGLETIQALLTHEIMHIILGHTHNAKAIALSHSSYMHDATLLNIFGIVGFAGHEESY